MIHEPTEEELAALDAYLADLVPTPIGPRPSVEAAVINAAAEALTQPITPLPITGDTVEEVKASAEAAITDLAAQMTERITFLSGG